MNCYAICKFSSNELKAPPVRPVLVEPWRMAMAGGVPGGSAPESMGKETEEDEELTTNHFGDLFGRRTTGEADRR